MKNKEKLMTAVLTAVCMMAGAVAFAPERAAAAGTPVRETIIAEGYLFGLAIKEDNSLWAWGLNTSGQLGDGTTTDRHSPIKVMDNVIAVSAGQFHSMAIKTDGSLWTWGSNDVGQLGDGTTTDRLIPIKVMDDVIAIAAGSYHTVAVKADGSLWSWGYSVQGGLGAGTTTESHIPIKVMDEAAVVSADYEYTMAIKTDGSLWAWGRDMGGQLGDGLIDGMAYRERRIPFKLMDNVATVSTDFSGAMAIKTDGSLWAWGWQHDYVHQLDDGPIIDLSTPYKVVDDVVDASASSRMIIKTDGSLWMWEGNLDGDSQRLVYTFVKLMENVDALVGYIIVKADGSLWVSGWYPFVQFRVEEGGLGIDLTRTASPDTPFKVMDGIKLSGKVPASIPTPTPSTGITVLFKGEKLNLTLPILNISGRTMYPFRECLEAMGTEISWDAGTKTAKGALGGKTVEFAIDSGTYKVNGQQMKMDAGVTAFIRDGRTYIPIRYAAESLGFTVEWDEKTQTINIK